MTATPSAAPGPHRARVAREHRGPPRGEAAATAPPREAALAARLLAWYDAHRRALPWRAAPGERPDPYRVWLSEVMLQQTTVAAAAPYFRRFVRRWAAVDALAGAGLDEVLHAWQGLGYYARARNLLKCARTVSGPLGGSFPDTAEGLERLPGVGPYTAAAIAAIAFGRPVAVVDANVERVVARLYGVGDPLPAARGRIKALAQGLTPARRPGDFAQAMMDLGATVCTSRDPGCPRCPLAGACAARARGIAASLPRKAPAKARPTRRGVAFWLVRDDGAVWLRRRAESGLLGGMMEVPSTEWRDRAWSREAARAAAPSLPVAQSAVRWQSLPGVVRHTFTHFHLEIAVLAGRVPVPAAGAGADAGQGAGAPAAGGTWVRPERLGELALPTVMKKVVRHALTAGTP